MSNEYIVVNTKANNTSVWSTLASTYTPSKGEVCIIVPTVKSFLDENTQYTEEEVVDIVESESGVGIKIGDGTTVFKHLPLLTDISKLRPDWHETDTSSPNYIWHKPLMNNDMFEQSEKMALTLEDFEIKEVIDKGETKIYHGEEYYPVKNLNA